ncbi:hypothetical protein HN011_003462 [Eciton burchellii]|nr:hypothetical protein HN011_003462 [Eciton burchellii]
MTQPIKNDGNENILRCITLRMEFVDTWLAKIGRMKNQAPQNGPKCESWTPNVAEEQAHWIKYRTWFYKKKTLLMIEDFKMHRWQHSGGQNSQRSLAKMARMKNQTAQGLQNAKVGHQEEEEKSACVKCYERTG